MTKRGPRRSLQSPGARRSPALPPVTTFCMVNGPATLSRSGQPARLRTDVVHPVQLAVQPRSSSCVWESPQADRQSATSPLPAGIQPMQSKAPGRHRARVGAQRLFTSRITVMIEYDIASSPQAPVNRFAETQPPVAGLRDSPGALAPPEARQIHGGRPASRPVRAEAADGLVGAAPARRGAHPQGSAPHGLAEHRAANALFPRPVPCCTRAPRRTWDGLVAPKRPEMRIRRA